MQVPQLHMSLNNDSRMAQNQHLNSVKKSHKPILEKPAQPVHKLPSPPPLPAHFTNLTVEQIRSVKKFVFFIGYGRSGHSVVASLMDAHPNMIVADEYYLFDKLAGDKGHKRQKQLSTRSGLFDELYWNSYTCARSGSRNASGTHTKNYHLGVEGMWQGRFDQLKVIGEKTGGATAMMYHEDNKKFKTIYKQLENVAGVPLYAIHVVRNPYDMIATVALYHASGHPNDYKVPASVENKFDNLDQLTRAMEIVLRKANAVAHMKADSKLNLKLLEIYLEDLIVRPRREILSICKFLEVECFEEYLQACAAKAYPSASRSRDIVVWSSELKKKVNAATKRYDFFSRYSFNGS